MPMLWFYLFFGLIILDFIDFEIDGFFLAPLSWAPSPLCAYPLRLWGWESWMVSLWASRFSLCTQSVGFFSCTGVSFEFDRWWESLDLGGGDFWPFFPLRSAGELLFIGSPSILSVLQDTIELSIMAGSRRFFKL